MDAMTLWLWKEERVKFIEIRLKEVVQHPHNHWDEKLVYICSSQHIVQSLLPVTDQAVDVTL